jgi:site-specific recombinase XerD
VARWLGTGRRFRRFKMNLAELWRTYEADKRIEGFSNQTLKGYGLQLRLLIRDIGDINIEEISEIRLKEYLAKHSQRLKPSTLGNRIRFIRSFFALLHLLYSTGCRVGEVHRLNIHDINWENCSAIVQGKGSKQREVYFTVECRVWLKRYLALRQDSNEALFITERNPVRRLSIASIRSEVKKIANRGKVQANVYPHRFRHTYACHLLDNGAPIDFIQGMLGHEKASTTQIYAQLRGERRREFYKRFF